MIYKVSKYSPTFLTCLMALKDHSANPVTGNETPTGCLEKLRLAEQQQVNQHNAHCHTCDTEGGMTITGDTVKQNMGKKISKFMYVEYIIQSGSCCETHGNF